MFTRESIFFLVIQIPTSTKLISTRIGSSKYRRRLLLEMHNIRTMKCDKKNMKMQLATNSKNCKAATMNDRHVRVQE